MMPFCARRIPVGGAAAARWGLISIVADCGQVQVVGHDSDQVRHCISGITESDVVEYGNSLDGDASVGSPVSPRYLRRVRSDAETQKVPLTCIETWRRRPDSNRGTGLCRLKNGVLGGSPKSRKPRSEYIFVRDRS